MGTCTLFKYVHVFMLNYNLHHIISFFKHHESSRNGLHISSFVQVLISK